jgi:hypothetical protein
MVTALAFVIGLATILSAPIPISAADDKEIANALRAGALTIVLRHGSAFRDQADYGPDAVLCRNTGRGRSAAAQPSPTGRAIVVSELRLAGLR